MDSGITTTFTKHYGRGPELTFRSPGRINLIGDHTDYCGLPVLPMAIAEGIDVAAAIDSRPGIRAVSTLDGVSIDSDVAGERTGWGRYVLAVNDQLAPLNRSGRGAELAFDGDLPSTGGLSSSSALAVGTVAALNQLWELGLDGDRIVELTLAAERAAAVAGGAMDQTVITFASPANALLIGFDPAARTPIPIPAGFRWIAGYSGTKAPKGDSAADAYNSFVLASRAAATLLARAVGGDAGSPAQLSRVRDAPADAVAALPTVTVAEAADLTGGESLDLPPDRPLDLRTSAEHVLSEATRVEAAADALRSGDRAMMGRLMDESHESLGRYGSTTDGLDRLVVAARGAGADGARVTGAGFGGWAIALASDRTADAVAEAMIAACGGPAFEAVASAGVLAALDNA
ncbi:MAG: galactokinase family protein [Actinomycetota bacterium]